MTSTLFAVILCFLIVSFVAMQYLFLKHIKELEFKLLTGEVPSESKKPEENQIMENKFVDIADVSLSTIANNIKSKVKN
jgi:hypothetical protein